MVKAIFFTNIACCDAFTANMLQSQGLREHFCAFSAGAGKKTSAKWKVAFNKNYLPFIEIVHCNKTNPSIIILNLEKKGGFLVWGFWGFFLQTSKLLLREKKHPQNGMGLLCYLQYSRSPRSSTVTYNQFFLFTKGVHR